MRMAPCWSMDRRHQISEKGSVTNDCAFFSFALYIAQINHKQIEVREKWISSGDWSAVVL